MWLLAAWKILFLESIRVKTESLISKLFFEKIQDDLLVYYDF